MRGPRTITSCCVSVITCIVSVACTPIKEPTRTHTDASQSRSSDSSSEHNRDNALEERDQDDGGPAAHSGK